ncbi:MAG: ATP-binding cassette domain-containing protein, partial [Candidatus Wallbacteria bacterium]|nr:ATP-binding cassette domain-containing protein [Candidatus Wallbacteria bacterium]
GNRNLVINDVNFEMQQGQLDSLVGPSGCSKSTFLKMILGTHPPRQGTVLLNGREILKPCRDVGIVYQKYSLFPNMTTLENVSIGPLMDRTTTPERFFCPVKIRKMLKGIREEAMELLKQLRLDHAAHLYPHEMSGGMQQRAAIAQALITKPAVLLLDEPFGALDTMTREECQRLLLRLYLQNKNADNGSGLISVILVTHELSEAILISDRVVALSQHWNWKESGFQSSPGATVVYDCPAPVFEPDAVIRAEEFREQEDEIKKAAFNPEYCQSRMEFLKYWKETEGARHA